VTGASECRGTETGASEYRGAGAGSSEYRGAGAGSSEYRGAGTGASEYRWTCSGDEWEWEWEWLSVKIEDSGSFLWLGCFFKYCIKYLLAPMALVPVYQRKFCPNLLLVYSSSMLRS
jgi:hypothetical protein